MYINLAGQNVIVLNTLQAAADLLDRKAAIYSSRPRFEVACNMLTEGMFFVFQDYGDRCVRCDHMRKRSTPYITIDGAVCVVLPTRVCTAVL